MTEPWKIFADTIEERQGLRWAIQDWKAEGQRIKTLAPLDFEEAVQELTDRPRLPSVHRQSA